MRVSLLWLGDFVDLPPTEELCSRLAQTGIEVEHVCDPAADLQGVVVAEVTQVASHPNADKLHVCQVFDGTETFTVVCGAPNVAVGLRVALARVGARLPGLTIEPRTIRGVASTGMLCAKDELGWHDQKEPGIWELPPEAVVGANIASVMGAAATLTLGITPNRPDLLSHLGVSREIAAATGKRHKSGKWRAVEKGPDIGSLARVVVEDNGSCKRYMARVVRNLKVGPSPAWLVERLQSVGQRSVNNVVDATNYVMHELGLPLHAFDLARLGAESGAPTVRVRRAVAGEQLTTLDGVHRKLTTDDLVIADAHRAIGLAGVMGGANSEVTSATVSVLLEAAYFEPMRIRQMAKRHGLRSEASLRFERGADISMTIRAVDRCAQLLAEIAEGDIAKGVLEFAQKSDSKCEIPLRLDRVQRLLGFAIGKESVVSLLEPLEIRCTARMDGALVFQAPTFRPDITREVDLIEEVARRHGYDRIPERLPNTAEDFRYAPPKQRATDVARSALLAAGCTEVVSYGFGSPSAYAGATPQEAPLRLLNPLGEEMSALRTSLLPGLLRIVEHNGRHGNRDIRLFETGTTFHARISAPNEDARDKDLPQEIKRAGICITGGRSQGRWYAHQEQVDFSDLLGVVETLFEGYRLAFTGETRPAAVARFNPHCAAELWLGDTCVGVAGQLDAAYLGGFGIERPVFAAEVSLDALAALPLEPHQYQPLPKFPAMRRDLAVIAPRTMHAETVRTFIRDHAGGAMGAQVVEAVRLFDVYQGKPIAATHVSLAFAIDYRHAQRTLTDDEVGAAFTQLIGRLQSELRIDVR